MITIINIFGLMSLVLLIMCGFVNKDQILYFFRQKGLSISICSYISCLVMHVSVYVINMQTGSDATNATKDISAGINNALSDIMPTFSISFSLFATLLFFIACVSLGLYLLSIVLRYKKVVNENEEKNNDKETD